MAVNQVFKSPYGFADRGHSGFSNPRALMRYFGSLWQIGTGLGGIDWCYVGNSNGVSASGVTPYFGCWQYIANSLIQDRLHPIYCPACVGGAGAVGLYTLASDTTGNPTLAAEGTGDWVMEYSGPYTDVTWGTLNGTGIRDDATGAEKRFRMDYSGSTDRHQQITGVRVIGKNGGNVYIDAYAKTGSSVTRGQGALGAYTSALSGVGQVDWTAIKAVNGGVALASDISIQIGGPGSGTLVSHLMLFNGDEACGHRLVNAGRNGALSSSWTGGTATTDQGFKRMASVAASGSGAAPNINTRLWVIDLLTNDLAAGVPTAANFKIGIQTLITAIRATTTPASIILVNPIPTTAKYATHYTYAEKLYELEDTNRIDTTVWDEWAVMGYGRPDTTLRTLGSGITNADDVHKSAYGHQVLGRAFAEGLLLERRAQLP